MCLFLKVCNKIKLMKKEIIIFAFIALIIIISGFLFFVRQEKTYPPVSNYDFYQVRELKQNNFSSGNYNTEGYVVKIYECPSCPADALCKPCMRDNIVISENNKIIDQYNLTETDLIVFVDEPKQF